LALDGPFCVLRKRIIDQCNKALDEHCAQLTTKIGDIYSVIVDDIDRSSSAIEDKSPEAQQLRFNLRPLIHEARVLFANDISNDMQQARACRGECAAIVPRELEKFAF
jgi:hypothetical protein